MSSGLSRRSLVKQSLAVGALASATVEPASAATYQINLICHGMMAFYHKYAYGQLEILVPIPYMDGTPVHEVRFGSLTDLGAPPPTLAGDMNGSPIVYVLSLPGVVAQSGDKGKHVYNGSKELAFPYDRGNIPYYRLTKNLTGIYCIIQIPMPKSMSTAAGIHLFRFTSGSQPLYKTSCSKKATQPTSIPEVVIFTFSGVTGPAALVDPNSKHTWEGPASPSDPVNVHLFSQPPVYIKGQNHLPLFNAMLTRTGGDDGMTDPGVVDNAVVTTTGPNPFPPPTKPAGLGLLDLSSLSELNAAPDKKLEPRNYSPADCINAWVYGC